MYRPWHSLQSEAPRPCSAPAWPFVPRIRFRVSLGICYKSKVQRPVVHEHRDVKKRTQLGLSSSAVGVGRTTPRASYIRRDSKRTQQQAMSESNKKLLAREAVHTKMRWVLSIPLLRHNKTRSPPSEVLLYLSRSWRACTTTNK